MNFRQIKETSLYVPDLEQAKEFYHGRLELPIIHYLAGKHLFLRVGTSVLLCFNPDDSRHKESPPGHFGGGKQHVAFEISSAQYDEAKSWISSKGIAITDKVTWQSGKESFYFEDPSGNVLEIVPDVGIWD